MAGALNSLSLRSSPGRFTSGLLVVAEVGVVPGAIEVEAGGHRGAVSQFRHDQRDEMVGLLATIANPITGSMGVRSACVTTDNAKPQETP